VRLTAEPVKCRAGVRRCVTTKENAAWPLAQDTKDGDLGVRAACRPASGAWTRPLKGRLQASSGRTLTAGTGLYFFGGVCESPLVGAAWHGSTHFLVIVVALCRYDGTW